MKESIYQLAINCQEITRNIKVKYSRIPSPSGITIEDYTITGDWKAYEQALLSLQCAIKNKYPQLSEHIKISVDNYSKCPALHLGQLDTIVEIVVNMEKQSAQSKRIFISHSSKDKEMVAKFVDHILQLGIGLTHDDIFCTSIEDMAIKNGEDIRKHIQDNIRNADYSFLLISKNYKESEICINEMGAVWAYDNGVKLYLLPDVDFDSIGWLCDTKKADKINNTIALDSLQKELIQFYSLPDKGTAWSRQRETFIKYIINVQLPQHI